MAIQQGSTCTLPDGKAGVVQDMGHYLDGRWWRVRYRNVMGGWAIGLFHEDTLSDVQDPPTYEVGDRVRLGPEGPVGTVTEIVSGAETTYGVRTRTETPEGPRYHTHYLPGYRLAS